MEAIKCECGREISGDNAYTDRNYDCFCKHCLFTAKPIKQDQGSITMSSRQCGKGTKVNELLNDGSFRLAKESQGLSEQTFFDEVLGEVPQYRKPRKDK